MFYKPSENKINTYSSYCAHLYLVYANCNPMSEYGTLMCPCCLDYKINDVFPIFIIILVSYSMYSYHFNL